MSEKSESTTDTATSEPASKPADLPESSNEEAPSSLETISSETTLTRNETQTVPKDKTKIDILLRATANAPIMKQKKWAVSQDHTIGKISDFVRRYLKLEPSERLILYVNQTFAPAPDQTVKNLYDCYGANGKLVLHYCKGQAWG